MGRNPLQDEKKENLEFKIFFFQDSRFSFFKIFFFCGSFFSLDDSSNFF